MGRAPCRRSELAAQLRPLAPVAAELVVQKVGQSRPKRPPVTATVAAAPLQVAWRPGRRATTEGEERMQACWLVAVRLERVAPEPWRLLTDRPIETAEQGTTIFRRDCQRWAIEDACKVAKTCVSWEDVQVLDSAAVRLLVALSRVATGFLFDLGVTLE